MSLNLTVLIAALAHMKLRTIMKVGAGVLELKNGFVSPNLFNVLCEAMAFADRWGVGVREFVAAYKEADDLRNKKAVEEDFDRRFIPLNFAGRPEPEKASIIMLYALVNGRVREEALEEAFSVAVAGYEVLEKSGLVPARETLCL